jgi:hypothetical protein
MDMSDILLLDMRKANGLKPNILNKANIPFKALFNGMREVFGSRSAPTPPATG